MGKIIGYVVSDVGLIRSNNEDNFLLRHCMNEQGEKHWSSFCCQDIGEWTCAGVFDGMGGVEGGEIASLVAARIFQENTFEMKEMSKELVSEVLEDAFKRANEAVIAARKHQNICGTTGSVIATNGNEFCVYHRGDSRVYHIKENELFLVSKDQTLAQLKLDVGIYHSKDEVPEREYHQLTEFIGMDDTGTAAKPFESEWIRWSVGERILLCSDGLYDMCHEQDILRNLQTKKSVEEAAHSLLQLALNNGGKDNITILILERV